MVEVSNDTNGDICPSNLTKLKVGLVDFYFEKNKKFQTIGGVGFSWVKLNGHVYLLSKKKLKIKKDTCHPFKVICRSLEKFFFLYHFAKGSLSI